MVLLYGVLQWPVVVGFSAQSVLEMASDEDISKVEFGPPIFTAAAIDVNDKDTAKVELGSPIFRAATIDVIEGVNLPPPPYLTPTQESKLWRKMDLRLLPILSFIYLMAFMDRGDLLYFGVMLL